MKKDIYILQPGRIGDIIISLPIAEEMDKKYNVKWPVCRQYVEMFNYVDYAEGLPMECSVDDSFNKVKKYFKQYKHLDLVINGSRSQINRKRWAMSEVSFDEWPYKVSGVDFSRKKELHINRNYEKEKRLADILEIDTSKDYILSHSKGSRYTHKFKIKDSIEIKPVKGYCIFDWVGLLENAAAVYAVDSCIANLMEGMQLCKGRRYYHPWTGKYKKALGDKRLTPVMSEDWKIC